MDSEEKTDGKKFLSSDVTISIQCRIEEILNRKSLQKKNQTSKKSKLRAKPRKTILLFHV
jgi:hypothetical protein